MRISDWSSDVCSSDLLYGVRPQRPPARARSPFAVDDLRRRQRCRLLRHARGQRRRRDRGLSRAHRQGDADAQMGLRLLAEPPAVRDAGAVARRDARIQEAPNPDRKSGVSGKSVSVRVDLGGRRIITKKQLKTTQRGSYITKDN